MHERLGMAVYSQSPIWVQNLMCTVEGRRLQKLRFGGVFPQWAKFYATSRHWSEERLRDYQRTQIQDLLHHCFHSVPYYAECWRREGLSSGDFKDLEDLRHFPRTTKENVLEAGQRILSSRVERWRLRKFTTGGSTGIPLPLYYTTEEIQQHYAVFWDRVRPGVTRGDRYATFQAKEIVPRTQSEPPFWRENRAANQRLYSMGHLAPEKLRAYAEDLVEEPFVYYQGYPSFMSVVAEYMREKGMAPRTPPKAVYPTSEQLTVAMRRLFETTWQTKVWDEYCQGEHCAMIAECEEGSRHVQMDYGVVEYEPIGHEDGQLVAEIICTGLIARAAPLIRYRVGDRVLINEGATCPCGRPGQVISAIRGRTTEYILTPDGRKYLFITPIVVRLRNVHRTQVVQERVEEIVVSVVPGPHYSAEDEKHVIRCFEEQIGGGIHVIVKRVNQLERLPNGKVLMIVNRIPGHGRFVGSAAESD